jgi:hypothetical protein
MIIRKLADAIRQQNWFTVILEILIVVIGLFIGLQLDDWNQRRIDRATEAAYLQELLEDFEANRASLENTSERLETILRNMNALLGQSVMGKPDWTIAQLNDAFIRAQDMPAFIAVVRTYTNLTGSGDLRLIRNRELKNDLAQYFATSDLAVLIQNTQEMELVSTFQPYIIKNLDYQAVYNQRLDDRPIAPPVEEERILDVLHTREFRNILTQKHTISADLLEQHRRLLAMTDRIIEKLGASIGENSTAAR